MLINRTLASAGYRFSANEIHAGQFAAGALVVGALCLIEMRLKRFAMAPPAQATGESPDDTRFLMVVRVVSFGSFIGVVALGILLREMGS